MVAALTVRRVLDAVARAVPDKGDDVVTRVDIRNGWAGAVHVRVHSMLAQGADDQFAQRLRRGVAQAVAGRRHTVEIVWASAG